MAEIVNLRRARKARARVGREEKAAQNRVAFGRTRAERERAEAEADIEYRRVEAHRLTPDGAKPEGETLMRRSVAKRSLTIAGHRTSVSLEPPFWEALAGIAAGRGISVAALVAEIDTARGDANLSSALRLHALAGATRRSPIDG